MATARYCYVPENPFRSKILESDLVDIIYFYICIFFQAYVSTVQSKTYPVTGFQWHPEVYIYSQVNLHLSFSPFAPRLSYDCGLLRYPTIVWYIIAVQLL